SSSDSSPAFTASRHDVGSGADEIRFDCGFAIGLPIDGFEGALDRRSVATRPAGNIGEVTADRFQHVALALDLRLRAHAESTQERQRRTPALNRVQKEERTNYGGDNEEAPVDRGAERQSDQASGCRLRFEDALEVPLAIELVQATLDRLAAFADALPDILA